MSAYIHSWTDMSTGWVMGLLLVPAGEAYPVGTLPFGNATITLKEQERKYNELPTGWHDAETLTFDIRLTDIPSAATTAVKAKRAASTTSIADTNIVDYARNTWVLYSNRGSGSPTNVEFVGVQSRIFGATYNIEADTYSATIELEDAYAHALKLIKGTDVCDFFANTRTSYATYPYSFTSTYDVTQSAPKPDTLILVDVKGDPHHVRFMTWGEIEDGLMELSRRVMHGITTHTQGTGASVTRNAAMSTVACEFYKATEGATRGKGAALDETTMLIPAFIETDENYVVGGYCSTSDGRGFATYETLWDWYKDMADQFGVRCRYNWSEAGSGATFRWVANMQYDLIKAASSVSVPFGYANGGDTLTVTEGDLTIGYAEARFEGSDEDNAESKFQNQGSRATRSYSAQIKLHNAPSIRGFAEGLSNAEQMWIGGLTDTDRMYFFYGTNEVPTRAHETVRMYYTTTDYIEVTADGSAFTTSKVDFDKLKLAYISMQNEACLHNAVSKFYATAFASEFILGFELTYPIALMQGNAMTAALGDRHAITGTIPTLLSQYAWDSCIVTGVKVNWNEGTSTISYVAV